MFRDGVDVLFIALSLVQLLPSLLRAASCTFVGGVVVVEELVELGSVDHAYAVADSFGVGCMSLLSGASSYAGVVVEDHVRNGQE